MPVELTEALLSTAAGWDVMKRARAYLEQGEVVSSNWAPPLLVMVTTVLLSPVTVAFKMS